MNDLGLSIDMLDVDKLRTIGDLLAPQYPHRADLLWDLANRLDTTVREIGELRTLAGVREEATDDQ